jgi:hypothetical protein
VDLDIAAPGCSSLLRLLDRPHWKYTSIIGDSCNTETPATPSRISHTFANEYEPTMMTVEFENFRDIADFLKAVQCFDECGK